ncbi:hypothetical protein Y1Q_0022589 [Alligator mississippiensis]|uniref:Uncharacterized protein n=1 Tax=Alligator mississippiensis TaxID=8496 RepID=A0A151NQA1_ALLMI|nr:hypothetical protein Y1Q_0022589 [Alligator mississippiensis]
MLNSYWKRRVHKAVGTISQHTAYRATTLLLGVPEWRVGVGHAVAFPSFGTRERNWRRALHSKSSPKLKWPVFLLSNNLRNRDHPHPRWTDPVLSSVCLSLQQFVPCYSVNVFRFGLEKDFLLQRELYLHMAQGGFSSDRLCYLTHFGQCYCSH